MPKKYKKIDVSLPLNKKQKKFCLSTVFSSSEEKSKVFTSKFFKGEEILKDGYYFADTLIERPCKKKPENIHYEVISQDEIGSSGTSSESGKNTRVYLVKGTLKYDNKNQIIYKDRSKENSFDCQARVAKIVPIKSESRQHSIEKEYQLTSLAPHIGMKPPSFFSEGKKNYACLIMKKLVGKDLFEFIYNKKKPLTTNERIDLSIALLKALNEQVHQIGLIHRDLKPENIRVFQDKDRFIVNIFDFGLSKKQSEKDKKVRCGTPGYISPEMIRQNGTTEKSDIFAMGIILGLIWGAESYPRLWTKKQYYLFKFFGKYRFDGLFREIRDLDLCHQAEIKNILMQSISSTIKNRPYVEKMLHVFKEVKHYRSLSYISIRNPTVV